MPSPDEPVRVRAENPNGADPKFYVRPADLLAAWLGTDWRDQEVGVTCWSCGDYPVRLGDVIDALGGPA